MEFSGALRQQVLDWLAGHVPESRLIHILAVEQAAIALAQQHNLDVNRAAQAGLMHDLAKYFKPQKLLQMAQAEGLALDPVDRVNPHLLHAEVGAIVARDQFGIQDEEVLQAIANHTLGKPGMSPLSCVVFLADSLEPGRGDTLELNVLREASQKDLSQAVWMSCDAAIQELIAKHRLIHPRTLLTRNWFLYSVGMGHSKSPNPFVGSIS
ncbi:MAG: HD domain-containing protein [Leptolyngbyaceae cyanobacterium RM2_2_4]|nr:HD domain-containing protein [Leptolyngbyaceae cyanobacterium SM1_4_3]NJO49234.1 HD domain-containing protein [Leptolyngbyaceae cyanobacterium RM2_2_4]